MNSLALEVIKKAPRPTTQSAITLTEHQRSIFEQLLRFATAKPPGCSQMAVVKGYAGTGKTTLVSKLICHLAELQDLHYSRIAIAAPTNKAVKVLREKIPTVQNMTIEYGSIHSFAGMRMIERENGEQECKKQGDSKLHEYGLVIIDEASMISDDLFRIVVSCIRTFTKVIFVGDPAQLPPVGQGTQSQVFQKVQMQATLSEVVRQAQDNPIIRLSMAIREAIEANRIMSPRDIASNLPSPSEPANACLANGGQETIINWTLYEINRAVDCRIIAYTNAQVTRYNQEIHETLHGITECMFVPGERVIVHEQTEARSEFGLATLHTSEELEVIAVEQKNHPRWKDIDAFHLTLKRDNNDEVTCYFPADQDQLEQTISSTFKLWREYKQATEAAQRNRNPDWPMLEEQAKQHSSKAWAMRKAFANLRHCYAITAHKSQGSTFDTAIIDYNDLAKIRTPFDFNRALYVAITRPRNNLAIVI